MLKRGFSGGEGDSMLGSGEMRRRMRDGGNVKRRSKRLESG